MVGFLIPTFPSIAFIIQKVYHIEVEQIQFSTSIIFFFTMASFLFNIFWVDRIGFKNCNIIFACVNLIGLGFRHVFAINFSYFIIGSMICGFSNAFILSNEMRFFKNWFAPKRIQKFFPLIVASIFIGNLLGAQAPFWFIDEEE